MADAPGPLAIVGPGLIGTSIGLAARRRWSNMQVRTIDRGQPLTDVAGASIVILAAPVDAIIEAIPQLPSIIDANALVIDTGSTKASIMQAAAAAHLRQFVGGHPMAGGTTAADARADLFDGRTWFLVNPDDAELVQRASAFVAALGATPVVLADHGEEHDRLMAAISHLPQVTSTMLMAVVARAVGLDNLRWAGSGLRDTTRLAASGSAMWESVLGTNKHELRPLLKHFASEVATLADMLDDREVVRQLFDEANRARAALK